MILYLYVVALFLIYLTAWYIQRRKLMSTFKSIGIPGPEPNIFSGNLAEINSKGILTLYHEWEKKHGKVFGYFFGSKPVLVISDAEICKQILIKDFSSFVDRPVLLPGGLISDDKLKHIISSNGKKWKEQRAILTPAFTTGKMKQMMPLMNKGIDIFLDEIGKNASSGASFDIFDRFKGLTLDVIGRTAFGIETNVQRNRQDPFLLGVKDLLHDTLGGLAYVLVCFHSLQFIILPIRKLWLLFGEYIGTSKIAYFVSTCFELVLARRANPQNRRKDMLQSLLDAQMSKEDMNNMTGEHLTATDLDNDNQKINEVVNNNHPHDSKRVFHSLTNNEVVGNTFIMLFAGFETTSTALSYVAHVLVTKQDIQDKIRQEIKEVEAEDGELSYESISKMKYLDQIWSETLRYYPPVVSFVNRVCATETRYGDLIIPKGVAIQVPVPLLHRNPDYWTKPNTFDPERFSIGRRSEILPAAYQPFGSGPRNCIGMRFAQLEAKLTLARLLKRFKLIPSEKTETGDIEVMMKFLIMSPKNGVVVKAVEI